MNTTKLNQFLSVSFVNGRPTSHSHIGIVIKDTTTQTPFTILEEDDITTICLRLSKKTALQLAKTLVEFVKETKK